MDIGRRQRTGGDGSLKAHPGDRTNQMENREGVVKAC